MSPELIFLSELALKMAMTATIVVIISVAVERSGPFIGALIAALPTAAGAAYIILAFEHPPDFIAASAVGSAAAAAAVSIFALVYTILAQRHGLMLSLGIAMVIWFVAAAALRLYDWTPLTAFILNVAGVRRHHSAELALSHLGPAAEIPAHAPTTFRCVRITAAIVVAVVTTASYSIGSFASGMFAVFPIVMGSSIVILHPRVGGKASASMLAHAQIALIGLWLGFLALHYLVAPVGVWRGFGARRSASASAGAARCGFVSRAQTPGLSAQSFFAFAQLRLERVKRFQRVARRHFVGMQRGERFDHSGERVVALRRCRCRPRRGEQRQIVDQLARRRGAVLGFELRQHQLGALDHARRQARRAWRPGCRRSGRRRRARPRAGTPRRPAIP